MIPRSYYLGVPLRTCHQQVCIWSAVCWCPVSCPPDHSENSPHWPGSISTANMQITNRNIYKDCLPSKTLNFRLELPQFITRTFREHSSPPPQVAPLKFRNKNRLIRFECEVVNMIADNVWCVVLCGLWCVVTALCWDTSNFPNLLEVKVCWTGHNKPESQTSSTRPGWGWLF